MNRKSNIYSIIFSMLFVIVLVSSVTFAVYTWYTSNDDEDIIEGMSTCFDIVYVKGYDIGSNENSKKLSLGSSYEDGLSTTIKINIDSSCKDITGNGTLYLNTEEGTSDYLIDNNILNYQVLDGNSKVSSGIINEKGSIPIYSGFTVNKSIKSITVYVWVNGENVTNDNRVVVTNSIYKGNISASVENR